MKNILKCSSCQARSEPAESCTEFQERLFDKLIDAVLCVAIVVIIF